MTLHRYWYKVHVNLWERPRDFSPMSRLEGGLCSPLCGGRVTNWQLKERKRKVCVCVLNIVHVCTYDMYVCVHVCDVYVCAYHCVCMWCMYMYVMYVCDYDCVHLCMYIHVYVCVSACHFSCFYNITLKKFANTLWCHHLLLLTHVKKWPIGWKVFSHR